MNTGLHSSVLLNSILSSKTSTGKPSSGYKSLLDNYERIDTDPGFQIWFDTEIHLTSNRIHSDYVSQIFGCHKNLLPIVELLHSLNDKMKDQCWEIVNIVQALDLDYKYIPYPETSILADGAVLIEWNFEHYRIGISIEDSSDESSWFLVSTKEIGSISASGYLEKSKCKNILSWLFNSINSLSIIDE